MLSQTNWLKEEEKKCFALNGFPTVRSVSGVFCCFLFKNEIQESFTLWVVQIPLQLPRCGLYIRTFLHLTCKYTLPVIGEEGRRGKQELTLYPQALRDPILLEQEQREKGQKTTVIINHITASTTRQKEVFI